MTTRYDRALLQPAGLLLALAVLLCPAVARGGGPAPPQLTFDELIKLSQQDTLDAPLQAKLDAILTTPVVRDRPSAVSRTPAKLRVMEWNIERGENLETIQELLASPDAFLKRAQEENNPSAANLVRMRLQAKELLASDVVILNEVDIGVKRTDYKNVVDELARMLGMNSAYAVEFLEVDALTGLGTETAVLETAEDSARMSDDLKPDRSRYQGLHVNAILSRYPLKNVHVITLPVCHDWYADEKKQISQLEQGKRKAANIAFLERITREVRRGNRNALAAEINVPGSTQPVTIVNAHLENKCKGDCRNRQMKRVLESVSGAPGPLVLAGDLNTTGTDGTPTSIHYELMKRVKDYQFWIGTLVKFTPVGIPAYATTPFNLWKNFRDPTAMHVPIVGRNPESAMFSTVRKFKFADGGSFDFRELESRNAQRSGKTLSDSNERATKGFVPTFSMNRDFGGVIRYRLDWIFVKPAAKGRRAAFYPKMPVTMNALNDELEEKLSDHAAILVEIPTAYK